MAGAFGYHLAIISARRPQNVPDMVAQGVEGTWYVPDEDIDAYQQAGAASVVGCGPYPGLSEARNRALDDAFAAELPCVQTDDDLTGVRRAYSPKHTEPMLFRDATSLMLRRLEASPYRLAAIAPTPNAYFYRRPITTHAFCIASFCAVLPSPERFDTALRVKEDYDFSLQHMVKYGGVARCDDILANYKHYRNAGGAVGYRSDIVEQEAIATLRRRWGDWVRLNPRRVNEVLLNVKRANGKA